MITMIDGVSTHTVRRDEPISLLVLIFVQVQGSQNPAADVNIITVV